MRITNISGGTSRAARAAAAFLTVAVMTAAAGAASATAPAGAYGHLVKSGAPCAVWWAEGAYKVMKDDPVPLKSRPVVRLSAARNEYEPFIIVLRPGTDMTGVSVSAGPLVLKKKGPTGGPAEGGVLSDVSVCHVGYVRVTVPTDERGRAGWWPDPLPPYDGPFSAAGGENHPLWLTVRIPKNSHPGLYAGEVRITSGSWSCSVPVEMTVRDFTLPDQPSVRSSFGMSAGEIKAYHNLETREELKKVVDLYYDDLRRHRVAPRDPFELYPMNVSIKGRYWEGGRFVTDVVHGGRRALMVVDDDVAADVSARTEGIIDLAGKTPRKLTLWARTPADGDQYSVACEFFTAKGCWIARANLVKVFKGTKAWKKEDIEVPALPDEAAGLRLSLFPAFRDNNGRTTGTAWFDDIVLEADAAGAPGEKVNLIPWGDFEMPLDAMKVSIDFTDFDQAGRRYLDEFGFNAFDLRLEGLGSGSFFQSWKGVFGGFEQGTPEYDSLMSQYLAQVEKHLAEKGWLGKEYIYWFDEPDPKDYPFVREGMLNIRRNAPRLTRFITEHRPGPDIIDVSEMSCTIFNKVDPAMIARIAPTGREFWSYLCTGPKSPWVTLFIDHPAVNMRMWLWMSYKWGLKGILVWEAMYWTSSSLFPPDKPENPWLDPMSYTVGYGIPYGSVNRWGNGDGRFIYPPNRDVGRDTRKYLSGPVDSIRWEIMREGLEDYEYFRLLDSEIRAAEKSGDKKAAGRAAEAARLLDFPKRLFSSGTDYTKDPLELLAYRDKVAAAIEGLKDRNK